MKRIDRILKHDTYLKCVKKNHRYEKSRIFCRHDMGHFLAVARIAHILNLEKGLCLNKELLYAAALLHDIGRFRQYEDDIPHDKASAELAPEILRDSGFTQEEIELIVDAIKNHRNETIKKEKSLRGILYRADKLSRNCYFCAAEKKCDWKQGKKNTRLRY